MSEGPESVLDLAILIEDPRWEDLPSVGGPGLESLVTDAVRAAVAGAGEDGVALSLAVVLSDDARVAVLNTTYRGKDGPTNVLSFAAREFAVQAPEAEEAENLGDVILALETCRREAEEQGKTLPDHLCHLIVHGVLHLLGYDHQDNDEAEEMEQLETTVLKGLGIADPYAEDAPGSIASPVDER